MKTVTYILRGEPARARKDNVVDLAAWRAEHLDEPETAPERYRDRGPVRRRHRRPATLDWAEMAATLAVAVAFIALAARVLLF